MCGLKIKNNGLMDRYLYSDLHETIISDKMFVAVQQEKPKRNKNPEQVIDWPHTLIK